MLTEVAPTFYAVKVNGVIISSNLPSRQVAEAVMYNLPADQRPLAEVVIMTSDGKTVLFG
jgi:uncharacterized protein YbaA (DUF1428 family)